MKKLLWAALAVILCAALGLAAFIYAPHPALSGHEKLAGLAAPVTIYRDPHGVPHIFAGNAKDGYAALGYLHAGDRLFQMEMMRRAGQGRLAEVLGRDLVAYDMKMRTLGFYKLTRPYYEGLSRDAREALDAYAAGVNAYRESHALPLEFKLLGFKPDAWQPWDGLIWAKMMAWQLSGNFDDEVLREQLLQKGLSKEQVAAIYPIMDHDVPSVMKPMGWIKKQGMGEQGSGISDQESGISGQESGTATSGPRSLIPHPSQARFFERLPRTASNAYVIAGEHTQSGKPILANDPHLQLQSPILWYIARIVTPEGELKGASAPGLPFFPLGQNNHVAWGFTTSNIDVEDITFVPADTALAMRHEVIHVKGEADIHVMVEENDHGVVIDHVMPSIRAITPQGKKALLQFTGLDAKDRTAQALFHINRAASAVDIEAALGDYSNPPQNFVYADASHVGYRAVGRVPKRGKDGFYARENTLWNGVLTHAPYLRDPKIGLILSANQPIVDDKECARYSCNFARDYAEPYRAMRLEAWFQEALKDNAKLDVQGAAGAMLDDVSAATQRYLPVILNGAAGTTQDEKDMLAALRAWDGRMAADKAEPLIYHAWLDALMRHAFKETYLADVTWPRMMALERQRLSPQTIQAAFSQAIAQLQKRFGPDWRHWQWGAVHSAPLLHPVWSKVPIINRLVKQAVRVDGDAYTLRRAAPSNYNHSFKVEHGAGYRGVYDLADPSRSLFMLAGGQSGQIFSPYYGSLRSMWSKGEFITLSGTAAEFQKNGAKELTLSP